MEEIKVNTAALAGTFDTAAQQTEEAAQVLGEVVAYMDANAPELTGCIAALNIVARDLGSTSETLDRAAESIRGTQ